MVLVGQPPGRVGSRRLIFLRRAATAAFRRSSLGRVELHDGDIKLRPWTLDDVPAIVAACNDPEIHHWIPMVPSPYTEADARAFVEGEVPGIGTQQFAITQDGRVVGSIGMGVNNSRTGHIGYWCAREARGRGVTTRALRLLSKHALEDLRLERLE